MDKNQSAAYAAALLLMIAIALPATFAGAGSTPVQQIDPTAQPQKELTRTVEAAQQPMLSSANVQDFDGVPMVLVPAGCFMMGSENGFEDEQPAHEQCFAESFWIDQTEVTQAQFARFGGVQAASLSFPGENRPVDSVTWFEAHDFCALRGARLPTEAEWEYAARGPENYVFPWGDEFVSDNLVWGENSGGETAEVGSRLDGASWVGALDMSGNVWEWVNSLHESYPYSAKDGREADTGTRADVQRMLRGGSWSSVNIGGFRAAFRLRINPRYWDSLLGFRCARSS
ncbi:MAG: formylglycine-generating enzyme family protein [Anaerolineae bacterium]|nr:formylglycine-generating enzyme family protein [Anaerolineae bacterium]NUQ04285.1 formylglycine-generating enzyme family protein [Anaerolineae bacterium]